VTSKYNELLFLSPDICRDVFDAVDMTVLYRILETQNSDNCVLNFNLLEACIVRSSARLRPSEALRHSKFAPPPPVRNYNIQEMFYTEKGKR
jgi:hypothetical protein